MHRRCTRAERQRLYKHWLDSKAASWGDEVSDLVQQLEDEQHTLARLFDRASLNVSAHRIRCS